MIHNDALVIVEGDGKTTFGKVGPDVDPVYVTIIDDDFWLRMLT